MADAQYDWIPPSMALMRTDTLETKEFQFNPEELTYSIECIWNELEVVGSSFQPMQYGGTRNIPFSFTLKMMPQTLEEYKEYRDTLRFLYSLNYTGDLFEPNPRAMREEGAVYGSPPDILFTWPGTLSLLTKSVSMSFTHSAFNKLGRPVITDVQISLKNVRVAQIVGWEIRDTGLGLDIRTEGLEVE